MRKHVMMILMAGVLVVSSVTNVFATQQQINDAKKQKEAAQSKLNSIQNDIENIESSQEEVQAEIEEIDSQLVDLLLTVNLINSDIQDKEQQIIIAEDEYVQAQETEEAQRIAMNKRIKFMYEKGDSSYMELFLQSQSIAELINKVDYIEKLYEYDRELLLNYQEAKEMVHQKKLELENEKAELEEIQADYMEQSENLKALIAEKQATVEDFATQLSKAKKKASSYQAEIKAQTAQIKKLEAEEAARKKAEEEARKKAEAEAKKKKSSEQQASSSSDKSNSGGNKITVEGSGLGVEIANYASQFVGNPYVAGGTSLTNGADCSGFTMAVYQHFGISIPRNSSAQAVGGREVSYAEAQPGDIIYYGGHVGIYMGNGMIVHASTPSTGIKYSNALYRSIITVRRYT